MEASLISFMLDKLDGISDADKAQRTPLLGQIHACIDRINAEFQVMKIFLESSIWPTTAAAAAANRPLESWIERVRTVAFKVEDIIDEYLHIVEEQRELTWKDYLSRPLILCSNLSEALQGIDSRLGGTEKEILELLNKRVGFGLTISKDRVNLERDTPHYRASSPMIIDEDVVGMEENISELLSWLTDADTRRETTAIAIWGMDGLGKTTLASNVYRHDDVKRHFECQVWVTVSQTYSVEELLRKMIQEIFKGKKEFAPNGIATWQLSDLLAIIQKKLQQKRYIIVLDDVRDGDLWDKIHDAFVDSNNGSRVIVTTGKQDVARRVNEERIIGLQPLDEEEEWILFCKKAFRRENNIDCPQRLEDYAGGILDRCQGSPLAIVAIGSLLSFKGTSEPEWKKVHDRLQQEFKNNSALDKVKNILDLCFNDLPYYLKNCFVYCSIFPEDYLIRRKKLIRLWVAEGFVTAKSSDTSMENEADRSLEDEAENYLAELVERSILQAVDSNGLGIPKAFRMHGVVREVTLAISRKAKFCLNLDGSASVSDEQTRRLSLQTNDTDDGEFHYLSKRISGLRSLVAFDTLNLSSLKAALIRSEMLRVLDLERVSISKLPDEVSALFNLHYLGLRKTQVKQLPNNIQKLQSLQTLDLHCTDIAKLPRGVAKWKQLRHLFVPKIEVEFEGARQWNNLQTLKCVRADKNLMQRLGDMKELRWLGVAEVKQAHRSQLCASLTNMKNLRSLLLSASHGEQLDFGKFNPPRPRIQKLNLFCKLFEGKLPRFIASCKELTCLKLFESRLKEDPLPSIGQLPKLVELRLENKAFDEQTLQFKAGWFHNLKRLVLEGLINLNRIVIEKDAMTNLRELYMADLMALKMFPPGIEHLTHLQSLDLFGMPEQLMGKLRKDSDDNEDKQRIQHIPRVTIG